MELLFRELAGDEVVLVGAAHGQKAVAALRVGALEHLDFGAVAANDLDLQFIRECLAQAAGLFDEMDLILALEHVARELAAEFAAANDHNSHTVLPLNRSH